MPLNSVNTNTGAMVALQSLNSTTSELATTQARINTGRKINDAKDNAAIWAIAQGQRAEVSSYGAVKESLHVASRPSTSPCPRARRFPRTS
jgi:flagellin